MARAAWVRELMAFSVRETPCAASSAQRIKERRRKKREDNIELKKEDGQGTAEPGHGGPAQVLASNGRHVMMRCVRRDGDDGLRRSEHVAAEITEEEKPSPLNALSRLRLSSSFAPPLLSSSRAGGGGGEATRPSRRRAPVDAEEEPPPPLATRHSSSFVPPITAPSLAG
uniref:Uncharacterized protein n=1 Tax=Oryza sativa subsp. japonica TaxID=39947 RepID=Q69XY0_ORYSJ|nr:hypothetical protein [Oryza sativa Japonica Group]